MNDLHSNKERNPSHNLQVWCCEHCRAVHFRAGNVLLDFSRSEFARLTQAVMEIYQQEFGGLEFYRLLNELNREDEVLSSRTIA